MIEMNKKMVVRADLPEEADVRKRMVTDGLEAGFCSFILRKGDENYSKLGKMDVIYFEDGEPVNEVVIEGPLCKEPVYRRTPLGREICDMMLAVPRAFRRADYLPCILWGRTAQDGALCHTRDCIRIRGRLQSRNYTKQTDEGPQERTAYEISALTAEFPENEA